MCHFLYIINDIVPLQNRHRQDLANLFAAIDERRKVSLMRRFEEGLCDTKDVDKIVRRQSDI